MDNNTVCLCMCVGTIIDQCSDGSDASKGTSVKAPLNQQRLEDLDKATAATTALVGVSGVVSIVRVHDVRGTRQVCDVLAAVENSSFTLP